MTKLELDLNFLPTIAELNRKMDRSRAELDKEKNIVANYLLGKITESILNSAERGNDSIKFWADDARFYLENLGRNSDVVNMGIRTASLEEMNEHIEEILNSIKQILNKNTSFIVDDNWCYRNNDHSETVYYLYISWSEQAITMRQKLNGFSNKKKIFIEQNKKKSFTKTFNPFIIKDESGNLYRKTKSPVVGGVAKRKLTTASWARLGKKYYQITDLIYFSNDKIGFYYGEDSNHTFILDKPDYNHFMFYKPIN